jgi:hypothetical protein
MRVSVNAIALRSAAGTPNSRAAFSKYVSRGPASTGADDTGPVARVGRSEHATMTGSTSPAIGNLRKRVIE